MIRAGLFAAMGTLAASPLASCHGLPRNFAMSGE